MIIKKRKVREEAPVVTSEEIAPQVEIEIEVEEAEIEDFFEEEE